MTEAGPGARIGHTLRAVREERLLSRRVLAERAGVNPMTIDHIERGLVERPRRTTLEKLAKPLGVPVEDLIGEPRPLELAPEVMYPADEAARRRALEAASAEERERYAARLAQVIADTVVSAYSPGDWGDIATDESKPEGERRVARRQLARVWQHIDRLSKLRAEATGEQEPEQEELAMFAASRTSVVGA